MKLSEFKFLYDSFFTTAIDAMREVPLEKKIWAPISRRQTTKYYYYYFINMILFHMVPAIFLDGLLKLFGRAPM
ncbi:hypothetical protein NQ314_008643 [Rhamnusium bicolor]|uniref:Uncharacterized protein n=1 Tax=Rhamnusium bicolor TaxID=1586634 RepID=A0AAV8Y873_9CUCU|nr:hypothetical protein NQ314_008643 [Rhamnusium bicolor]